MSHPQSYIAYRFEEKGGNLVRAEVQWQEPKDGQVVVKVLACGVCASDDTVKYQAVPTGLPRVPGHEIVGEVVAVPPTETQWTIGQRVGSGWHGGHCYSCKHCIAGDWMMCEKESVNGVFTDGGFAQYATLRRESLLSVPEDMDPAEVAPLLCAGLTTYNALRNMDVQPPETVAIQGIGGLGHLAVQFSHAMGFRTIALSSGDSKRELAKTLGADEYINTSTTPAADALLALGGAKVILVTAPSAKVIENLVPALTVNGTLVVVALMQEKITFDVNLIIQKRASLRGWPSGTARDSDACVKFAKLRGIKCMVQRYPLEKAQEAYEARGSARFRAVIVPN